MIETISTLRQKKILIAPLDWGLGHAARCIPIIQQLLNQQNTVVMASSGDAYRFLAVEFPDLQLEELPTYDIVYSDSKSQTAKLLLQIPKVWKAVQNEKKLTLRIVKKHEIDIIISDNRFGVYCTDIPSYFITHQLKIIDAKNRKWMEWLMMKMNFYFIQKFTECWIPDHAGENNLSGTLSHNIETPFPIKYIGTLSRFKNMWMALTLEKTYKIVVLISGPEPQKTIFQKIILSQIDSLNIPTLVCLGNPGNQTIRRRSHSVDIVGHLPTERLYHMLFNSELVISRSGYSTIMDLESLGKKAIFIPTPGQSEQEYLAQKFKESMIFFSEEQSTFHLDRAMKENERYKGWVIV